MQYVFFDIECASVYKNVAKICAFGYCITDEKFNILKQEELLINPKGKFNLTNAQGIGLVLPYDYKIFQQYPMFTSYFPKIKLLLEDKKNIIVGHAVMNDAKFLFLETKRYKLEPLYFSFYDTQILYMASKKIYEKHIGLENLAKELGITMHMAHNALQDALTTMQITKFLCKKEGLTLQEFLQKNKIIAGYLKEDTLIACTSYDKKEYQQLHCKLKQERAKRRIAFQQYAKTITTMQNASLLQGLHFTFDQAIEEDFSQAKRLLHLIVQYGATYTHNINQCTAYLAYDNKTLRKRKEIFALKKLGQIQKIFTVEELLCFVKTTT